ncbi:PUA-like domain-containing protein [Triangularia verruculosa]|uniref:PUA-like domain-containing protein n=1 Tax=Triangularia verruculosa TaxID=2587418 RepID=A0AAN7AQX1_9PEZI|nr:PUA-like domain-containing protein [Triangularia verruculosa]
MTSTLSSTHPDIIEFMSLASAELASGNILLDASQPKDIFQFGGTSSQLADARLQLAIQGRKTATTSWPVPEPLHWGVGDYSVILDGSRRPGALMKTTELKICKFKDVADDFALAEAEGSVDEYKQGHRDFYAEQRRREGKPRDEFSDESEVLCERFVVVFVRQDLRQDANRVPKPPATEGQL